MLLALIPLNNNNLDKAADVFAMIVFVTDGYLKMKQETNENVQKFFSISQRLPVDLQQVIARRTVKETANIISESDYLFSVKQILSFYQKKNIFPPCVCI